MAHTTGLYSNADINLSDYLNEKSGGRFLLFLSEATVTHSFRLPPEYQKIKQHLQAKGTWHKTTSKFNVFEICTAIKQYSAFYGDSGDLLSAFEELRDHPTVESWLQSQGYREAYSQDETKGYALQELEEKAEVLGFRLLCKNEVAVNRNTYDYLKRCEHQVVKQRKNLNGWPF